MSLETLVFPSLAWAEFSQIISMLSLREIWILGCVNRSAFVTFLREKSYREGRKGQPINKIPRFLFKTSGHDKAALVSYPRSGNSFMRKVLERESGIVTGSDSRPNRTLSASLLKFGYAGEGITDQSVWVVKSHYPERLGYLKFPVARVILLVRNPFDAIQSYFHMGMTNTHDRNLSKESFDALKEVWNEFVGHEATIWMDFHKFWLEQVNSINILILRYEDLLLDEKACVTEVMKFLTSGNCPPGLSRYISKAQHDDTQAPAVGYKSRNRTIGKALDVMTAAEVLKVASITQSYMDLFGYKLVCREDDVRVDVDRVVPGLFSLEAAAWPPASLEKKASSPSTSETAVGINNFFTVRSNDDKFGRKITDLRKAFTQNDTKPFQVS